MLLTYSTIFKMLRLIPIKTSLGFFLCLLNTFSSLTVTANINSLSNLEPNFSNKSLFESSQLLQGPGLACQNEPVMYTSTVHCNSYTWHVGTNAEILNGGTLSDNFILLKWKDEPQGIVDLTLDECTENYMNGFHSLNVRIIQEKALINGPAKYCPESEIDYHVHGMEGIDFNWTVPSSAIILDGQGTDRIKVKWNPYDSIYALNSEIKVEYSSCFLDCNGSGSLEVQMVQPGFIQSPDVICPGVIPEIEFLTIHTKSLIPAYWFIKDDNGNTIWASAENSSELWFDWNISPGIYSIEVITDENALTCTSFFSKTVEVKMQPEIIKGVTGNTIICPEETFYYKIEDAKKNELFEWTITNGTDKIIKNGKNIFVEWGKTPPYQLEIKKSHVSAPNCKSDPYSLELTSVPIVSINGPETACLNEKSVFSCELFEDINYNWEIIPASMGIISSSRDSHEIKIHWKKVGNATIVLSICNDTIFEEVTINDVPDPIIISPEELCENESDIVTTSDAYSKYSWKTTDEVVLGQADSISLGYGNYFLEIENQFGCTNGIPFFIKKLPTPDISISHEFFLKGTCEGWPGIKLTATENNSGYNYQWYHDGTPLYEIGNTIQAIDAGDYHVEVANEYGCFNKSDSIEIKMCEDAGGTCFGDYCHLPTVNDNPPNCLPEGNISAFFSAAQNCREFYFTNNSNNFIPGSLQWEFGDPKSGSENFSNEENPFHKYKEPGYYFFRLTAHLPNANDSTTFCTSTYAANLLVRLKAGFEVNNVCENSAVKFMDISTNVPAVEINMWEWDFGDPNSGANNFSNERNPEHIYSSPGIYEVSLTITSNYGCKDFHKKEIEIKPRTQIDFYLPDSICQSAPIYLTDNIGSDSLFYQWDTGDGFNLASENLIHKYEIADTYTINLQATDNYGCLTSKNKEITILPNNLQGNIEVLNANNNCHGDTIKLIAPYIGLNYLWSNGDTLPILTTTDPGIYKVSIENKYGCTYSPPPFTLNINELPFASVEANKINEQGLMHNLPTFNLKICNGEELYLNVRGISNQDYKWNSGHTGNELVINGGSGYTLPVGQHELIVTITDQTTSCTNTTIPILLDILASPPAFNIVANQPDPLCEASDVILSVDSPDSSFSYIWNNGEMGNSQNNLAYGVYKATAITINGCRTNSPSIEIFKSPSPYSLPTGFYSICGPTEVCLPYHPDLVEHLWQFNGEPLSSPAANSPILYVEATGDYQVEMTSDMGCKTLSEVSNLEILEEKSEIKGHVWLDENRNYTIDSQDILLPNIQVILSENGSVLENTLSNTNGQFFFNRLPLSNYKISIDQNNLKAKFETIIASAEFVLDECGEELIAQFLITEKQSISDDQKNHLYIPNTFSPNSDNVNDYFQIFPAQGVSIVEYDLKVFDRWGGIVFHSRNTDNNWDGKLKNEYLKKDVYPWVLYATLEADGKIESIEKRGSVSLIR